eukprot:3857554-Alexandrium_andersonii.AAC.1
MSGSPEGPQFAMSQRCAVASPGCEVDCGAAVAPSLPYLAMSLWAGGPSFDAWARASTRVSG